MKERSKRLRISPSARLRNPQGGWRSRRDRLKNRPADSAPVEIRAGRYIVIAVNDFHLATENLIIAKRALNRFINNQMVAGDQVAIATTSGNVGMFQQFTEERDVLERAVNRLNVQQRTVTSSSDIPRITDYQAELIDIGDQDALELAVQEIMRLEPMPSPPPAAGRGGRGGFNPGGSTAERRSAKGRSSRRNRGPERSSLKTPITRAPRFPTWRASFATFAT